jgi:hypothetical protein
MKISIMRKMTAGAFFSVAVFLSASYPARSELIPDSWNGDWKGTIQIFGANQIRPEGVELKIHSVPETLNLSWVLRHEGELIQTSASHLAQPANESGGQGVPAVRSFDLESFQVMRLQKN